jgi:catechol 2,3-dioxygenase-like lactoylglutathione lyase family enzyme
MLQESPLYAYFPAKDLDRARRFWEGKLGFVPKSADNGGVTYAFANGTAAFLYPTANAGTSKASQAFWSVEDVDLTASSPKAAWFKDSEGNALAIIQDL